MKLLSERDNVLGSIGVWVINILGIFALRDKLSLFMLVN